MATNVIVERYLHGIPCSSPDRETLVPPDPAETNVGLRTLGGPTPSLRAPCPPACQRASVSHRG
jgi:hypothetical protein